MKAKSGRVMVSMTAAAIAAIGISATSTKASAQSEPFIGQLILVPYIFCPRGWTEAAGQTLPINENAALFSLLGTTYGGDGRTSFNLPDLRGRVPVHVGSGPGLSRVKLGEQGGREQTTPTINEMAAHSHASETTVDVTATLNGTSSRAGSTNPAGYVLGRVKRKNIYGSGPADVAMGASSVSVDATANTTVETAGKGQSLDNRPPYLGMRWCIALQGIFPSRH